MPFGYVLKPIQERDLKVTLEMALYISKIDKERRLTEIRLKDNEKKYRSLFNSINDGFCLHELVYDQTGKATDYKVVDVNPRYEEILKIKKEDVIDKMASIIYQAEIPPYLDVYVEVTETGESCRFETFYPPMKKHFLISVFSYEKDKFVTVFQDITDRKNSEEELKKREEWFSTTLRSIGDAVITTDKKSVITSLNPIAEKLTGWKQEEAKGKPLLEIFNIINEETRKPVENPVQKVLKEDRIVGLANHTILIAKDGTEIPIDDSGSPITNEQGEVYGVVLVFRDIIERKKSEEALRESEEKHRTLFETMTQGVVYQNAEGIITDANPAAERILGLSLSQLQGKTSMDPRWRAIHEDGSDFPGDTHPISVALKTGKPVKHVIQGVFHPDSEEYRWIRVNAVPKFKKGESTPYEAYAIFDDFTDERKK
ncbi:PAS domain S-box protein [bacterium]|nr:PAS domain S-box protein [bacterium]